MDYIKRPFEQFFKQQISGSILLIVATIAALIIANSPLADFYQAFWLQKLKIGLPTFNLNETLIHWINDGLMAIFFFVIGLEIKREILVGELNDIKKATLPIFGAVGGMVIPVGLFFILHGNNYGVEGWGIPMATDIAFTLGILQLLGKRVPLGLKVFLTAFAIVDDIGAVLVIAIFYSGTIQWNLLIIALAIIALLFTLGKLNFYSKYLSFFAAIIVWILFLKSGIHPTIAGILLAFTIPVKRKIDTFKFYSKSRKAIEQMKCAEDHIPDFLTKPQRGAINMLEDLTHKTISPLQHLEHKLHGWVTFVIMPIFAFANAGVDLSGEITGLSWNLAGSMVFGKFIGITLFALLAIKLKLANLPENVNINQLIGASFLGGLGFTMALFISGLAYTDSALIDGAKTGIIMGSIAASVFGYIILKISLRNSPTTEISKEKPENDCSENV